MTPAAGEEEGGARQALAFIIKAGSVPLFSGKASLWVEALRDGDPLDSARLLEFSARFSRQDSIGKAVFMPLLDYRAIFERVGNSRMASILDSARSENLCAALLFLEDAGPPRGPETLGNPPDPITEQMSLGHKKTAVRGLRSPLLERLLKDPDERVVREALRNPRLRESEVVAIASRRPCPEEVFYLLAASPGWIARPAVERAVLFNPYAPVRLATLLLVCQPSQVLLEVINDNGLHPSVRDGAREILAWT
ncbi:hypothetical protein EPN96_02810 [bacterium]|nr:MAG: hypothetical protein EPN96_02810 [bacterium]